MQDFALPLAHTIAHFKRGGTGPAVLILHGGGGPEMWVATAEHLISRGYEVILPSHPGFLSEGRPEWLETVGDLALHYSGLIGSLGLNDVHLIGHSLGGWIAAELSVMRPDLFSSIQLISSAGIFLAADPIADNFLWNASETADNLIFDPGLADAVKAKEISVEEEGLRYSRLVTVAKLVWNPRWHNPHLHKWLHRINAPVHLVWGKQDKFIPSTYASEFARLLPSSVTTLIEDCGHIPPLEKPAELLATLTAFMGRH
jgi:pimeloyl-ACP methyl ester carboxylesterase